MRRGFLAGDGLAAAAFSVCDYLDLLRAPCDAQQEAGKPDLKGKQISDLSGRFLDTP